ncbi:16657_t:CDS:2 [Rhizophagus irregularis]|nr:16657_t:CDS:2 [Rhizophagus irregularis]
MNDKLGEDEQFFEASDSQSGSRIPSIEELENCNKLNATFSERINKLNEGTAPTKGIEKGVELEKKRGITIAISFNQTNLSGKSKILGTSGYVDSLCKRRNNRKQNYFELEGPTAGESVGTGRRMHLLGRVEKSG